MIAPGFMGTLPGWITSAGVRSSPSKVPNVPTVSAAIVRLLFGGRPPAIFRRIWAVVVYSVDGMTSAWARAHVLKKSREISAPSVAYRNASAPVLIVGWIARDKTPGLHSSVGHIFRGESPSNGCAVRSVGGNRALSLNTSAAKRVPASEIGSHHDCFSAAIALAQPARSSASGRGLTYHHKPLKALPCQLYFPHALAIPQTGSCAKVRCDRAGNG